MARDFQISDPELERLMDGLHKVAAQIEGGSQVEDYVSIGHVKFRSSLEDYSSHFDKLQADYKEKCEILYKYAEEIKNKTTEYDDSTEYNISHPSQEGEKKD